MPPSKQIALSHLGQRCSPEHLHYPAVPTVLVHRQPLPPPTPCHARNHVLNAVGRRSHPARRRGKFLFSKDWPAFTACSSGPSIFVDSAAFLAAGLETCSTARKVRKLARLALHQAGTPLRMRVSISLAAVSRSGQNRCGNDPSRVTAPGLCTTASHVTSMRR